MRVKVKVCGGDRHAHKHTEEVCFVETDWYHEEGHEIIVCPLCGGHIPLVYQPGRESAFDIHVREEHI